MTSKDILTALGGTLPGIAAYYTAGWCTNRMAGRRNLPVQKGRNTTAGAAVCGLAGAVSAVFAGTDMDLPYVFAILFLLISVSIMDIRYRIIPNGIALSLILTRTVFWIPSLFSVPGFPEFSPGNSLAGALALFVLFALPALFGKAVGCGDVKLALALGFVLGLRGGLLCTVLMGTGVLAYAAFSVLTSKIPAAAGITEALKRKIPLGPALAFSAMCVLLSGYVFPVLFPQVRLC